MINLRPLFLPLATYILTEVFTKQDRGVSSTSPRLTRLVSRLSAFQLPGVTVESKILKYITPETERFPQIASLSQTDHSEHI